MTLVTCPDCRNAVPRYAASCTFCGRSMHPATYAPAGQPARPVVERPAAPFAEQPAGEATERPAPPYAGQAPYGAQPAYGYGAQAPQGYGAQAPYGPGAQSGYGYGAQAANAFSAQKSNVQMVYALYAAGLVFGPLGIVAVVMSYIRKNEVRGSWMEPHYLWVIDTFWSAMLGSIVGVVAGLLMMMAFFPMGIMALMALVVFSFGWPIYRLVVGWTALNEGRIPVGKVSSPRW